MTEKQVQDSKHEGRDEKFMDIDRMVNEGLGGGNVTMDNGFIGNTTTDSMDDEFKEGEDV